MLKPQPTIAAVLGHWLGALVMTGACAAMIFPSLKELAPTLPAYAAVGDHWKIAAGVPQQRIFLACDIVQALCAIATVAMTGLEMARVGISNLTLARQARVVIVALVLAVLAYYLFVLSPRMSASFAAFLAAAQQGDSAAATHRAEFDRDHPIASTTFAVLAAGVALALICTLWPLPGPRGEGRA